MLHSTAQHSTAPNILLVTLHTGKFQPANHGNKLQNYALQEVLKNFGLNVYNLWAEMLENEKPSLFSKILRYPKGFAKCILALLGSRKYRRWLKNYRLAKKTPPASPEIEALRTSICDKFDDEYIINKVPSSYANPLNQNECENYQYAITGSDMVWRNWSGTLEDLEYFYLSFMPAEKRVCYAPSFGFKKFPARFAKLHKKYLAEFKKLSCREIEGCNLIKQAVNKEVLHVLDPALLLNADDYLKIARKPKFEIPEHYVFVYHFGMITDEVKSLIDKFSSGLKIIHVNNPQELEYYLTDASEFLWLMNNADYVYTNTFHGTVFSIIFKKKFISAGKYSYKIKDILSSLNLNNRIYNNDGKIPQGEIDYDSVYEKLNARREISLNYLQECLNLK